MEIDSQDLPEKLVLVVQETVRKIEEDRQKNNGYMKKADTYKALGAQGIMIVIAVVGLGLASSTLQANAILKQIDKIMVLVSENEKTIRAHEIEFMRLWEEGARNKADIDRRLKMIGEKQ